MTLSVLKLSFFVTFFAVFMCLWNDCLLVDNLKVYWVWNDCLSSVVDLHPLMHTSCLGCLCPLALWPQKTPWTTLVKMMLYAPQYLKVEKKCPVSSFVPLHFTVKEDQHRSIIFLVCAWCATDGDYEDFVRIALDHSSPPIISVVWFFHLFMKDCS